MSDLQGKVALVTGGASGIGAASVLAFAREGAKVVVADRDEAAGQALCRQLREQGGSALFVASDITQADSVQAMVQATMAQYGRLDCAFNNAGVADGADSLLSSSQENWDRVMSVNLEGVWHCMQAELEVMLAAGAGSIVNNASRAGLVGIPSDGVYGAAKHGVIGLTKAAAVEFASCGIRVNAVCPGLVETALTRHRFGDGLSSRAVVGNPLGRMAQPQEVAEAVLWLSSSRASFVVGVALPVDGGSTAR